MVGCPGPRVGRKRLATPYPRSRGYEVFPLCYVVYHRWCHGPGNGVRTVSNVSVLLVWPSRARQDNLRTGADAHRRNDQGPVADAQSQIDAVRPVVATEPPGVYAAICRIWPASTSKGWTLAQSGGHHSSDQKSTPADPFGYLQRSVAVEIGARRIGVLFRHPSRRRGKSTVSATPDLSAPDNSSDPGKSHLNLYTPAYPAIDQR